MLRRGIFYTLLLLVAFSVKAQTAEEVDAIVAKYPKHYSSTEELAERINADFSTEYGRARAIYSWIAFNINYDVKSYLYPKRPKPIKYKTEEERQRKLKAALDKRISKVLRKGKGICGGYAALFHRVASQVGLQSEYISGNGRTKNHDIGKRRIIVDHGWNSVKIDGTWRLLDVTWGAGYVNEKKEKFYKRFNSFYFDTDPKLFFTNHYPKTGVWENTKLDKVAFLKAPLLDAEMREEYEIIEPKEGTIKVCKDDKVVFKILNAKPEAVIRYTQRKRGETPKVENKTLKEDVLEFEITIDKTIGRYLTLFLDGEAIATFKISLLK